MRLRLFTTLVLACIFASPAISEWSFESGATPNAFIQTNNMTLELQCDRIRFAPAGYEDSEDIVRKQGLSIRFLKNGSTETGAFETGPENASVQIVDNYSVEIIFQSAEDYDFILDQVAVNAALNLYMVDQEVAYGTFDLAGSSGAINSLRATCYNVADASNTNDAPEGIVYCVGGGIKRQIEFTILENFDGEWNARVTVNGETLRAMTAYGYFGNVPTPEGFLVAILGEDRSEFLIFRNGRENWLEFGDYRYDKCN